MAFFGADTFAPDGLARMRALALSVHDLAMRFERSADSPSDLNDTFIASTRTLICKNVGIVSHSQDVGVALRALSNAVSWMLTLLGDTHAAIEVATTMRDLAQAAARRQHDAHAPQSPRPAYRLKPGNGVTTVVGADIPPGLRPVYPS